MPTLPADLLAAYNTAIIDVVLPHGNFVVSAGVSAGEIELPVLLRPLFWVITPCNPRSKKLSARTNTQRFEAFWSAACKQNERGASCFQAVGRSPDGAWSEDSVAFVGMSEREAITLARKYDQNAVYRVTSSGVQVVVVGGP
jgi:hypothetical protein